MLLTNHRTSIGIEQQKSILKRAFDKFEDFKLIETDYLMPNEINLIIEEANADLISLMERIKKDYTNTKFILFLTEYLTPSILGNQLNTFDKKTSLSHSYIHLSRAIPFINLYRTEYQIPSFFGRYGIIKFFILKAIRYLFILPLRIIHDNDSLINVLELCRREYCLNQTKDLYDLCFSNCKAVNDSYKKFFNKKVILVPTFVDIKTAKKSKDLIEKDEFKSYYSGLFFSGRLTSFRKEFLRKLYRINNYYPGKQLLLYKTRIDFLRNDNNNIPMFEIYIKQEKDWPYSSPMRTLMSIERGYIPINVGKFDDHDINMCAIEISDSTDHNKIFDFLSNVDINNEFEKLYSKIESLNKSQEIISKALHIELLKTI